MTFYKDKTEYEVLVVCPHTVIYGNVQIGTLTDQWVSQYVTWLPVSE